MKKVFKTVALCAVLGTMAVGCQKENIIEDANVVAQIGTVRKMQYTIDGVEHHITLVGDNAWNEFLHQMAALAKEGHSISFRNEEASSAVASAKETVTFTTTDHDEACAWCNSMSDQGYTVYMGYDKDKGMYICVAVK